MSFATIYLPDSEAQPRQESERIQENSMPEAKKKCTVVILYHTALNP